MDEIISFIKRTGLQLNFIIVCSRFLKFMFISVIIVTPVIFILKMAGIKDAGIFHWLIAVFAGGLIGIITGFGRMVNKTSVSRWLDDNFSRNDVFSSALFCIERRKSGMFDEFIIGNAFETIKKNARVKLPFRHMLFCLLFTAGAFLISFILLLYINPLITGRYDRNKLVITDGQDNNAYDENRNSFFGKNETSQDLAKMLFPEDKKMSELAEKALKTGDMKMFNELMQREDLKTSEMIKNARTQTEKETLTKQLEKQKEIAKSIEEQQKKESQSQEKERSSEEDNKNQKDENSGDNNSSDKKSNTGQGDNKGSKDKEDSGGDKGLGNESGTERSDVGISDSIIQDKVDPEKYNSDLMLTQKKDSPEFEFLLPDKTTRVSLKDVIPDSKKSAESAVTRKGVPVEYEDFVKSYFISLLDEMKKNSSKGDEK